MALNFVHIAQHLMALILCMLLNTSWHLFRAYCSTPHGTYFVHFAQHIKSQPGCSAKQHLLKAATDIDVTKVHITDMVLRKCPGLVQDTVMSQGMSNSVHHQAVRMHQGVCSICSCLNMQPP